LRRRYALEPLGGPEGFGQSGGRAAALQKFLAGVFAPPFRACASGDLGGSDVFFTFGAGRFDLQKISRCSIIDCFVDVL
jgi:hypothetical protein